jgi:diguanylate cyclase (GGDEF)-like protein
MLARGVHVGFPVAIVICSVLYLTLPQFPGDILYSAAALFPAAACLLAMRIHRVNKPLHVWLLFVAMLLMAVPSIGWIIQVDIQGHRTNNIHLYLSAAAGYLVSMAASAVIVARHAPKDPGGVLHAALVGLGLSGLPWALVMRPALLAAESSLVTQVVIVVVVMSQMTIMGSLLRTATTTIHGRGSLFYLFVAMVSSMVAMAVTNTNLDQYGNHPRWADTIWFLGYCSVAAAVLHPALNHLTTPQRAYPDDMSARGLISTGLVLSVNPIVSIGSMFFGQPADVLLLATSALISVPLLLIRFWYLGIQRLRAEQALVHQAAHDELTGLPNRRSLMERVDTALREVHDGSLDGVAILFFDLDGFKPINDSLGHKAGDQVLRIVGRRLQMCVRATDAVGRLGGDEFLVMCAGMNGRSVEDTMQRLRATISEPITIDGTACTVGASIGVAVAGPGAMMSAEALIAEADQAMYTVKRARQGTRHAA